MTPAQVAQFRTEGWLHQPGLLTAQVAALRADVDRIAHWTGAAGETASVTVAGPWITQETGHWYTPVRDLAERSDLWHRVCASVIGPLAQELLGEAAVLVNATAVMKPAETGQTFPWHQDGAYYGPDHGRYVIANVYLDDVTPENGSLQVVPRTHDRLWAHHGELGKKSVTLPDGMTAIEPAAKAGDVCWFWLWTVHGSKPNHSPFPRRAVRVGYVAEAA